MINKTALGRQVALAAICVVATVSIQAQTLTDTWSYAGGGLSPATYGGTYRPASLIPDTGSAPGASITYTGMTLGGLGSSTYPEGYGGIYTFFSTDVSFTLQNTNILSGTQTITISILAGGGEPGGYYDDSVLLDFNLGNSGLESSSFSSIYIGPVETPIGPQVMTRYIWTWDVSALGASTAYSATWSAGAHVFISEVSTMQAVPEPSSILLAGLGFGVVLYLRKRKRRISASSL